MTSELIPPDHAHWQPVPESMLDLPLDDSLAITEGTSDSIATILLGVFGTVHVVGALPSIVSNGFTMGYLLWLVAGLLLLITAVISGARHFTRARRYYLLPGQIIRIDRYGRHMLPRERVDDLITREISDNGRAAVELLLTSGDWVPMKIPPGEVERVRAWFDEDN